MDHEGIMRVCDELGLGYKGHTHASPRGRNLSISCPRALIGKHSDPYDENMSCSVLLDDDGPSMARCFSSNCGYRGSFFNLVQSTVLKLPNTTPKQLELLKWLAENDKDSIDARARKCVRLTGNEVSAASRPILNPYPHQRDVLSEEAFAPFARNLPQYALDRGLDVDAAEAWDLGYDKEGGRLVFSVRRYDGALIGMTGRVIPSAQKAFAARGYFVPKYFNYSGLNKTRYLYGAHTWKKDRPVVLVEGPIDAVRVWMALGHKVNVGGVLGEGFSRDHHQQVRAAWPPAGYIFGDGDRAGRRMAEKIHAAMSKAMPMFLMRCPTRLDVDADGNEVEVATDPGELTDAEIIAAYEEAEPIFGSITWV